MESRNQKRSAIGIGIVCILAIGLSVFSIFSTYRMHQTAAMIYEHPYTVSNESRAMRSRLLDMRGFILNMLVSPNWDAESLQQTLNGRYAMQYESIQIIKNKYLGPQEDTERLLRAMQDLENTQNKAIVIALPMDDKNTAQLVEETLYPKYDAVNEALLTIITFADTKVQSLEKETTETAIWSAVSAVLLTAFLPAYFLVMFWRERKNIREIRYRDQLFDILAKNVDEVFFIFHKEKEVLEYVSANSKRILGIEESAIRQDLNVIQNQVVEEDRAVLHEFLKPEKLDAGKSGDIRMIIPPGEVHWMRFRLFPQITQGKVTRYIVSITDQTEDIRIQQTLKDALLNAQNANAAKQNFLSRMSHEIRTPMNAIIGMTTIAAAYIEDRKRVEDCLGKIGYSSKHLMGLINDVLDMSKIDEGKMTIAHETFDLESIAESITSIIYPQAETKGITFTMPLVDLSDTVLRGDSLRLNQILLNLLSNALKFTPRGGSVRLEIRQLQKKNGRARLRFTVSDTGIGMSEAFLERLFLPFEQESASTGSKYGGTGLGMSITKNLVTLMGGTISVKSELEKGSTFVVELDFDIPEEAENASRCNQALESLKVLVADDDRDSCIHVSLLLDHLGLRSTWVLTGTACVEEVLSSHRVGEDYDVCLIDWKMPDIDGIEVTRRVREYVGPDTTIIIITAYDWSNIEQSAREAGANAFLSKPIFASTLYNTLLSVTSAEKTDRSNFKTQVQYPALTGVHILLVEDNELNREIALELLHMIHIDVTCADNGQEAVDQFLANGDRFDLILMDVQMPIMDGYQATRTIRKSGAAKAGQIPIVAMTADAFHEDVVKAHTAGMNGHLAKPIDPDQLYQTIARMISDKDGGWHGAV